MPEVQVFQCPACGANLKYDAGAEATFVCQYCGTAIIVPDTLRRPTAAARAVPASAPSPEAAEPAQAGALAEITYLARQGRTVEAIKLYRETFDSSRAEALDAVQDLAAGEDLTAASTPVDAPLAGTHPADHAPVAAGPGQEAALAQIKQLASRGQTTEAVKLYRETFDSSHAEAESAVRQLLSGS